MITTKNQFIARFLRIIQEKLEEELPEEAFEAEYIEQAREIVRERWN